MSTDFLMPSTVWNCLVDLNSQNLFFTLLFLLLATKMRRRKSRLRNNKPKNNRKFKNKLVQRNDLKDENNEFGFEKNVLKLKDENQKPAINLTEDFELKHDDLVFEEDLRREDDDEATSTTPSFPGKVERSPSLNKVTPKVKVSTATYTVTISTYTYDQTEESVKVALEIPGIEEHSEDKILLTASEFSFKFLVTEFDGKNWSLNVSSLAHEIIYPEVKYNVTKRGKVVLSLPKKRPFKWLSLTPTDETIKVEWMDIMSLFFTSLGRRGIIFTDLLKMLDRLWNSSDFYVKYNYVKEINPSEELLNICFQEDPLCRSLDEVIAYAERRINLDPSETNGHILLGVAVLEKLIFRYKRTKGYNSVRISEEFLTWHTYYKNFKHDEQRNTTSKTDIKDLSSNEKTEEFILEFPSIDLRYRISNPLNTERGNEKSNAERLDECLEEKAQNHFKANNFTACVETLTEMIELFPYRSHLYFNRAACYLKLKKFKDSLEDGQKAVQLDRFNIDGWLCVGESHLALGTPEECLENLEKMLGESNNQSLENLIFKIKKLSSVLADASKAFQINDFENAAILYETASKASVANQLIILKLSECFALSGKFEKALAVADMLSKDEEDSEADGYYTHGLINFYQNLKVEALEKFDKCLAIDEGHEKCKELYKLARDIYYFKDRGNEYYEAKKYNLAIEMYIKGLTIDPKNKICNAIFNFNIGLTYLQLQKVANAISSFSTAVDLNKNYVKALLNRAEIFLEVRQFKDAVKDLEQVCKITASPHHKKLLQEAKCKLKSEIIAQRNFCSLSEKEQNKILAVSKQEKGNTLFRNQNYDRANELYSEAVALDLDCPVHYSNRSACQLMLKNYKEAFKDAVKSLELDCTFIKGYFRKGRIELIMGKGEEAIQTLNQGLAIDPNNKDLKEQKGKALKLIRSVAKGNISFESKDFIKAVEWFSEASDIASNCSDISTKKFESLIYCDRCDEVRLSLQQQEKDANYYYICALMGYHFEITKENAFANIEKALQADSNHSAALSLKKIMQDVYYNWELGISALIDSNFVKAQKFLKNAFVIDPRWAQISCDLGLCYRRQGKYLEAITHYSMAIKLKGNSVELWIARAQCYDRLSNYEKAVKDYEKVYQLCPNPFHKLLLDESRLKLKKSQRKDYYKVLSVATNASMEDIRVAYRRLAKEYHPDRHVAAEDKEEGEVKFKEINEAYNVLSDPLKREKYDRGEDMEDEGNIWNPFFFMSGANRNGTFGNPFFPFFQ